METVVHATVAGWVEARDRFAGIFVRPDRRGMDWADCCVLLLPAGRSAHLEAAFMAGKGKPVLTLVPEGEAVEPELMQLLLGPPDNICCDADELVGALRRLTGKS